MVNEIGGFIELELKEGKQYHENSIALNSCRNAIRYTIKAYNIKQMHVPYFTCPVVWHAIKQENCTIIPYDIDSNFMPTKKFKKDDFILYTNYWGVCASNIKKLSSVYTNLIIDNAQAFYMPHYGIASTYSPRKFFGVADGGFVICNKINNEKYEKDTSWQRFSHLIKRVDCGSNFAYNDFNENDNSLINEPIKFMSNLTYKMCANIDYKSAKQKRLENFEYMRNNLEHFNLLKLKLDTDDVPMYYPLLLENDLLRQKLIDSQIYIPSFWRDLETICKRNSYSLYLKKYLFPLIIDQRYSKENLNKIINIINNTIGDKNET